MSANLSTEILYGKKGFLELKRTIKKWAKDNYVGNKQIFDAYKNVEINEFPHVRRLIKLIPNAAFKLEICADEDGNNFHPELMVDPDVIARLPLGKQLSIIEAPGKIMSPGDREIAKQIRQKMH